jgi:gluconate kinase
MKNIAVDESLKDKAGSDKEILWMVGYPSAGKTFMGDYLATRGWHHIDGDMGNQTEDLAIRGAFEKWWIGMQAQNKGETVGEEAWHPYYTCLVDAVKEGCESHDKVVLTFAALGLFNGEEEFIQKHFPQVKFIYVKVDEEILFTRFKKRNVEFNKA